MSSNKSKSNKTWQLVQDITNMELEIDALKDDNGTSYTIFIMIFIYLFYLYDLILISTNYCIFMHY